MSAADFLLSPAVQAIVQLVLAEPARTYTVPELAKLSRTELAQLEQVVPHLLEHGVLVAGEAPAATGPDDTEPSAAAPQAVRANTAFVFYPELRRIALKSFAAAEPLRAMVRAKFRASVLRAFSLGEDAASGTLGLLLVYGDTVPDRQTLELALRKLLKTGAIRQHVQAHVVSDRQFTALKPGDLLHAQLAADTCVDISPPGARRSPAPPAPAPASLLQKARRQLSRLGR